MHNQHAGLSQTLAEQYITQRQQAAPAWLVRGTGPPRRRRRSWMVGGSWLGRQASPWSSQPVAPARQLTSQVDPTRSDAVAPPRSRATRPGGAAPSPAVAGQLPWFSWRSSASKPAGDGKQAHS